MIWDQLVKCQDQIIQMFDHHGTEINELSLWIQIVVLRIDEHLSPVMKCCEYSRTNFCRNADEEKFILKSIFTKSFSYFSSSIHKSSNLNPNTYYANDLWMVGNSYCRSVVILTEGIGYRSNSRKIFTSKFITKK